MNWKLFLDDDCQTVRHPSITVENGSWRALMALPVDVPDTDNLGDWIMAATAAEAIKLIDENGTPNFVSFDHDLGDGVDAMAVARYIIERDLDGKPLPEDFGFEVHSGNPVGRANIRGLLDNYLEFKAIGRRSLSQ